MNKVLIIDDDKELCTLIKRSVLSENIEADICNTGKEGLKKLKEKEYQLVILDVMMPGMDGFETLEEIRKGNSLPILMFTSKNDSASKVRGLRAGADDYLTKPFDMDELIARIVSLIRRYTRFNGQDGTPQQLDFDGLKIDLENRSITTVNGTFELPPKEFDLLLSFQKFLYWLMILELSTTEHYWKKKALRNWKQKAVSISALLFPIPHRRQDFWNVLSMKTISLYRTTIIYAYIILIYLSGKL